MSEEKREALPKELAEYKEKELKRENGAGVKLAGNSTMIRGRPGWEKIFLE